MQLKNQKRAESSNVAVGAHNLALVQMGEVHSRVVKLDYLIFTGEDPYGWLYKIQQFFPFIILYPNIGLN